MGRPGPPGHGEKKYKAYKLVVDPAMRQGPTKVYRFDGVGQPGVNGLKILTSAALFVHLVKIWMFHN